MNIGTRVKELRIAQRITLKGLAKTTGLTASFLSQLERNLASPSVKTLEKIAQALNTKISYFFFEEAEKKGLVFVKKGTGKKALDKEGRVTSETLARGMWNITMEPKVFTLAPGAALSRELFFPGGDGFGLVLKGSLEFIWEKEKLVLQEGNSVYCSYSRMPEKVQNAGKTEAKLLSIALTQMY